MTPPAGRPLPGDLVENLALFCSRLREEEIVVTPGEEIDAARALLQIDLFDGEAFYLALKTVLAVRRADHPRFDRIFQVFWKGEGTVPVKAEREISPRSGTKAGTEGKGAREEWAEEERGGRETSESASVGYSPQALLRRKSFDAVTRGEREEIERLLARLALRLAMRRSRRTVPALRRGPIDLRRSFRALLRSDGELLKLARRERKIEPARIVLLCDVSGSMDPHSRFILRLLLSLPRVSGRAEVFVFNTVLTHLTPLLKNAEADDLLADIGRAVPDWAGGTQIGACLAEFLDAHGARLLDRRSTVLLFSDGLDRGESDLLVYAMEGIRKRARKIIWLNPLLGEPGYQPLCRGMQDALPFVDYFEKGHNLESLEALVELL